MTTIEMLNAIANNNFKMPKSSDWKSAGIEAGSNFCLHLEKAWINIMKGEVLEEDRYFDAAETRLTAAFSCLGIVMSQSMFFRMVGLCQVKHVKDKLRYTSKQTFRKNALMYLHDCISGNSALDADEKLEKALGMNGTTIKCVSPEKKLERNMRRFNAIVKELSEDEKAALIAEITKAA